MQSQFRKFRYHSFLVILFITSLVFNLGIGNIFSVVPLGKFPNIVMAQSPNVNQLVERGIQLYHNGDILGAIAQWETAKTALQKTNNPVEKAIVSENLARAYQQIGQIETAINYWGDTIAIYRQMADKKQVGRMLVEQAQAYTNLGQNKRAIAILCNPSLRETTCTNDSALQITKEAKDSQGYAAALGSLGNAYRLRGDYEKAIKYLEESLAIANQTGNTIYSATSLNNLANVYSNVALVNYRRADLAETRGAEEEGQKFRNVAAVYDSKALENLQKSLQITGSQGDVQNQMRGFINLISVYYRMKDVSSAENVWQRAIALFDKLPNSRDKVYVAIDLANLLQPNTLSEDTFSKIKCLKPELQPKAQELLEQAIGISQSLKDLRAESFALGKLGHLYECRQEYEKALELTQKARWAADQDLRAKDSLYLWEWQAGRILKAQNKESEAIKVYGQAVSTLEAIRQDILASNRDLQFDFRDTINPIYRELAQLNLEQATLPAIESDNRNKTLNDALITIDSLKLAELQNYFGNDCAIAPLNPQRIDLAAINKSTAVFSSIILPDRTAILVSLPNGEKKAAWIDVDSKTLTQEINEFRKYLEEFYNLTYDSRQAQKLYNWIIYPFASDLERLQIKILVFVHDGILRSIPMAALHDGEKFLIQKYAIATTPSLTLIEPTTLDRQKLRVLAAGLTEKSIIDGEEFPALTNVAQEIQKVKQKFQYSKALLNENFTQASLEQELSKTAYPIIHIATHGKFGTEAKDTFLITGNNGKLTITDLDAAIRQVRHQSELAELLVLTACQTAVGDDRSALGLAGVAVQAGVKSALASLWSIDDEKTVELVTQFYDSYNSGMNKAEALRIAQIKMIEARGKNAIPAYWAAFVLVGNWL
ncbi:CHAT domain-containing protein [Aerosakkonemataceae cyanobacterium BLCC-F50]|uniref:CHAT domain-containing protein n=1 Tax=Floridaenema flaviceps BLCC-F50 TaxID=3153642 RepID=A0ABV4Y0A2_9CYAN